MTIFKKIINWFIGLFTSKRTTLTENVPTEPKVVVTPKDEPKPIDTPFVDDVTPPIHVDDVLPPAPPVSPKCLTYKVTYGGGPDSPVGIINYLDCKGNSQSVGVSFDEPIVTFCAQEDTVSSTWAGNTITMLGECGSNDLGMVSKSNISSETLDKPKMKKSKKSVQPHQPHHKPKSHSKKKKLH